jgi:hypothetical protein
MTICPYNAQTLICARRASEEVPIITEHNGKLLIALSRGNALTLVCTSLYFRGCNVSPGDFVLADGDAFPTGECNGYLQRKDGRWYFTPCARLPDVIEQYLV